jgi:two-component system, OmpR family, KDP operon response regulator KdpE
MIGGQTILVVDDEMQIRRLLTAALRRGGYETVEAATAREAINAQQRFQPVAALVDLGLPDRDGLELVEQLARDDACAVLVVSARDATDEKVAALDLGAVDYVTKPFDTEELLARLRVALRRTGQIGKPPEPVRFADIEIDSAARIVRKAGLEMHLTPKEYALLTALADHPGRVITHAQLLKTIWGPAHTNDVEYLRVAARALRLKLEPDPSRPRHIRNEPGIGYRLCE